MAITLQPSRNEKLCPFPILIESIAYLSFFGVRNLKAVEGLFIFFPYQQFDLLLFYLMERKQSASFNILQANWVVFGWYLINVRKKLPLLKLLYFPLFRWNMWHIFRKQLIKFLYNIDILSKLKPWTHQYSVLRHRIHIYSTCNFFQCAISSNNKILSSTCTPNLQGLLSRFLLMLKLQCIRVLSCKLVRCANKWSYRYWILSLDR